MAELFHYGVPGMRWGHRKHNTTSSSKRRTSSKMEDKMSYKYNKPGESGWVGLGRAIKAQPKKLKEKRRLNKLKRTQRLAEKVLEGYEKDINNLKKPDEKTLKYLNSLGLSPNTMIKELEDESKAIKEMYEKRIKELSK